MHHALTNFQRFGELRAQFFFVGGRDLHAGYGQLNRVLFETI